MAVECPLLGVKQTSFNHALISAFDPKRTLEPSAVPLKQHQLWDADLVRIGCVELSCDEEEGGLGEKDNSNHALIPDARFCVSKSQYALKLR